MLRTIQVAALSSLIVAAGCDRVQLLAPTNATITLSAPTRQLPTGGSTEVTALVVEQAGTPVQNGTTVRFVASLGSVSPVEVQTQNGLAITTFRAGNTSGVAEIRAVSGGATGGDGTNPTNVIQITIGGAAAGAVAISASPSTVPASGGTVTITAAALDESGNRLTGVPISFSTTAGTLSSSSVISDATGEARVQLTTNRAATVTARAGNQSAQVTVNASAGNSLGLSVTPTNPAVNQTVTLTVTPTVGTNNVAPRVIVTWGDGTQQDLGTVSGSRTVAHVYSSAGNYTIVATGTAEGETVTASTGVTVSPRAALAVSISNTTKEDATAAGQRWTFTATATEGGTTSTSIESYTWNFGDGSQVTTSGNTTAHVYDTGSEPERYVVTVTARTTDGRTANGQTEIIVDAEPDS